MNIGKRIANDLIMVGEMAKISLEEKSIRYDCVYREKRIVKWGNAW